MKIEIKAAATSVLKAHYSWVLRILGFMADTDKKVTISTLEHSAFRENGVGYVTMFVPREAFDLITTKKGKAILCVVSEEEYRQAMSDLQEHEASNDLAESLFINDIQEITKSYNAPNQEEQCEKD